MSEKDIFHIYHFHYNNTPNPDTSIISLISFISLIARHFLPLYNVLFNKNKEIKLNINKVK